MTHFSRRKALRGLGALATAGAAAGRGNLRAAARHSETTGDLQGTVRLSVGSPNGVLTPSVLIAPTGNPAAPSWEVSHRAGPVLLPSRLGLSLPDGRTLGAGAILMGHRLAMRDDTWKPP